MAVNHIKFACCQREKMKREEEEEERQVSSGWRRKKEKGKRKKNKNSPGDHLKLLLTACFTAQGLEVERKGDLYLLCIQVAFVHC